MSIYYTPFEVAQVIGKHLPNTVNSIIEPAVGCGLLLEPLMAKLKESKTHLTCVDVDGVALHETEKDLDLFWDEG